MPADPQLTVRAYRPGDQPDFKRLNLAWIEQLFSPEVSDLRQLHTPQAEILDKGGRILIAEIESAVVGCVALVPAHGDAGRVELIKMAVDEAQRGHGIGRALMEACVETAREMGAREIWLESNARLDAALALYRRTGFRDLTGTQFQPSAYCRCDVQMLLEL